MNELDTLCLRGNLIKTGINTTGRFAVFEQRLCDIGFNTHMSMIADKEGNCRDMIFMYGTADKHHQKIIWLT